MTLIPIIYDLLKSVSIKIVNSECGRQGKKIVSKKYISILEINIPEIMNKKNNYCIVYWSLIEYLQENENP